jgi:hypothetical protein
MMKKKTAPGELCGVGAERFLCSSANRLTVVPRNDAQSDARVPAVEYPRVFLRDLENSPVVFVENA